MQNLFVLLILGSLVATAVSSTGGSNILTFSYSGGSANFTVPVGATSMRIDIVGARGGHVNTTEYSVRGGFGG